MKLERRLFKANAVNKEEEEEEEEKGLFKADARRTPSATALPRRRKLSQK